MKTLKIKTEHLSPTSLRLSCHFNAGPDRVFEAWTNPAHIAKWFHPEENVFCHTAEVDPQHGGKYRIMMTTPGGPITAFGDYTIFDRPTHLQMNWQWDHEEHAYTSRLDLEMTASGKGTDFVMTHDRFDDERSRDMHQQGWTGCINTLFTFFDNQPTNENQS